MHGVIHGPHGAARKATGQTVSGAFRQSAAGASPDQTVSDESEWFSQMAQALLSKDAGFALHCITGFEERTCYRYASGERRPPAYFLRALLRSDQGEQFLRAVMDGSAAAWWVARENDRRDAERARAFARGF